MSILLAEEIFRDFETDGVPDSGIHDPRKSEIRQWGTWVEGLVTAFMASDGTVYTTRAALLANLVPGINSMAWVVQDPTVAYNGIYRKTAGSGSGTWTRVADLPFSVITLNDVGAGTANEIITTSAFPVPTTQKAIFILTPFEANTGDVELSINGIEKQLRTNVGGQIPSGGLQAGMPVLVTDAGATYRVLTDYDSGANLALAEGARSAAEAAAALATGAMSVFLNTAFATRALAEAYEPELPPDYILVEGYAAVGDGGNARYKKVGAEPTHSGKFSISYSDGGGGTAWYENVEPVLRPEMFGTIGVDAAGDTAAWVALVSTANARGGHVEVALNGPQYLIDGTAVVTTSDPQTFHDLASLRITMGIDTELRQQTALRKTLKFTLIDKVEVIGGKLYGYAQIEIDANDPLTELDLDSSSGNAVTGLYALNCGEVTLKRVVFRNHFGRDVICSGCTNIVVEECDLKGVGPTYNDPSGGAYPTYYPISGAHQGNGEDCALYIIPNDQSLSGTAWVQTLEVRKSRIEGHSFGIRTVQNGRLVLHDNYFGVTPGQYHLYDTDSDGVSIIGNHFYRSRLTSLKLQYENKAGLSYGPAYDPNGTYVVGDVVRASSILWICHTGYSPGGAAFSSTNWNVHPRFNRWGAIHANNIFEECGGGVSYIVPVTVHGYNIFASGVVIADNMFLRCTGSIIRPERCINSTVTGNSVFGGEYGMQARYFSGTISDNDFRDIDKNAMLISIAYDTVIEGNKAWDCGLAGSNNSERSSLGHLYALDGTDPPSYKAAPNVFLRDNSIIFTGGGRPGRSSIATDTPGDYLFYDSDSRLLMHIEGTRGTPSTKKFRIDGTLTYQFRNYFRANGYVNTGQNEPVPTDAATLITTLRAKDVVG